MSPHEPQALEPPASRPTRGGRGGRAARRLLRRLARDTRGVTLIEMLVAISTGLVVTAAAFALLEVSLKQTTRIADKTSANQRGRVAMEKILLELHSSCVTIGINPIQAESTPTSLVFVSQTAPYISSTVKYAEAYFTSMTKRRIFLTGGNLEEWTYTNTAGTEAVTWKFPELAAPTHKYMLLKGVAAPSSGSVFEYYKYNGTSLSTVVLPSGEEKAAKLVAQVNIRFLANPESANTTAPAANRQTEVSDSAVLRLTPATPIGTNEPCE